MSSPPQIDTAQIGLFAYYNYGATIDLNDTRGAFYSYLQHGNYIDGVVRVWASHTLGSASQVQGDNYVDVKVRIRGDGWILAWFARADDSSKILWWGKTDGTKIPRDCLPPEPLSNRLSRAINIILIAAGLAQQFDASIHVYNENTGFEDGLDHWYIEPVPGNYGDTIFVSTTEKHSGAKSLEMNSLPSRISQTISNLASDNKILSCWGIYNLYDFMSIHYTDGTTSSAELGYGGWHQVTLAAVSGKIIDKISIYRTIGTGLVAWVDDVILSDALPVPQVPIIPVPPPCYFDYEFPNAKKLYFLGINKQELMNCSGQQTISKSFSVLVPNSAVVYRAFLDTIIYAVCHPNQVGGDYKCTGKVDAAVVYGSNIRGGLMESCSLNNHDIKSYLTLGIQHTVTAITEILFDIDWCWYDQYGVPHWVGAGGATLSTLRHIQGVVIETS